MKKTLYEQVQVTEELPPLPEKGDVLPVLTDIGNAYLTEFGTFIDDNEEDVTPKWWSRPVTVTLPQEVSDEAIGKYAVLLTQYVEGQPDFMDVKNNCTNAMTHMRDLLLPYLATLQGRIEELEAGIETLVQMVNKSQEPRHLFFVIDKLREIHKSLTSKPKP